MRIMVPVKLIVKQAAYDFDMETMESDLVLEDHKEETVVFRLRGSGQFLMEREELRKFLAAAGTFC